MNEEIKEILEQLEWYRKIGKKDVYYPECVLPNKKAFILLDYITNLQQEIKEANDSITWWTNRFKAVERDNKELKQKIEQYENPDDMTLFYMWLDTKAKDKIKELQQELEIMVRDDERSQETIIRLTKENETRQQDINNLTYQLAKMKEENERLKEIWKDTNVIVKDDKTLVMNTNAYDTLEDYKSRLEKASELINKQKKKMYKSRNKIALFILLKLEKILQNGSEENGRKTN